MRTGEDPSDCMLVVFVRMDDYPDDIMEKMDRICEEYESDLIDCDGFILLTTDFQSQKYSNDLSMV